MGYSFLGVAAAVFVMGQTGAPAARPPSAAAPIQTSERTAALSELRRLVAANYVVVEKRDDIVRRLQAREESGAYAVTDPGEFAGLVTADLRAASDDLHLSFDFNPSEYAEKVSQRDRRDYSGIMRRIRDGNHGYVKQEILAGNVRYVKIADFRWIPDESGHVVEAAVRFLKDGEAVILDLRGNAGGDPRAVQYLISHFFETDTELTGEFDGVTSKYIPMRTLSYLPAGRLTGKPLYVLIDGDTFSAGEEFAYEVRQYRLGQLIGEKTAGGANGTTRHPVAGGFIASISDSRLIHPLTGANWEGVGVEPDIATPGDQALDRALLDALSRLRASTGDESYDWTLTALRGRASPPSIDRETLSGFAGQYGVRRVWIENDALLYRREDRPSIRLAPLTDDTFQMGEDAALRVRFIREAGRVVALEIQGESGLRDRSDRTGD